MGKYQLWGAMKSMTPALREGGGSQGGPQRGGDIEVYEFPSGYAYLTASHCPLPP